MFIRQNKLGQREMGWQDEVLYFSKEFGTNLSTGLKRCQFQPLLQLLGIAEFLLIAITLKAV